MALIAGLRKHWRRDKAPEEAKASATAKLGAAFETAVFAMPGPRWSSRSYEALIRRGYERNPVVQRSIRLIADSAGQARWTVSRDGTKLDRHPLLDLVNWPTPQDCGTAIFETAIAHLLLAGNAFLERVDDVSDRPVELYALRPERMTVVTGKSGWPVAYDYKVGGKAHRFEVEGTDGRRPILHLRSFNPLNDHYGLSGLVAAARAIDIHNAADDWNKALLDNAARPSGALVFEPKDGQATTLSDDQFARLRTEMDDNFQGSLNAGRPLLLEGGLKWQQMALSPADMHHHDTKNSAARDIALAFGVPPMLLGIPGDNTFSNYQEANRALWRQTILPLLDRLATALNGWLAPAFEPGIRLNYDRDQIAALASERTALWKQVSAATFLSDEEKRALLGLPERG